MAKFTFGPGLLRLTLALFVVVSHLTRYEIGRPAVFVFFMLSGYWVMKMYAEKYAPAANVWVFYLSRWLRIWLPFAIVFGIVFLVRYKLLASPEANSDSRLLGILMLGVATTHLDALGVSWSLDIELQFYLLVPLILLALRRLPLAVVIAGVAVLSPIGWWLQVRYDIWTVFSYFPSFLAGCLIWFLVAAPSTRTAMVSLAAFLGIAVIVSSLPTLRPLLFRDVVSPFHEDWFGMAWVVALLPFVAWNVRQPSGVFDRHMGALSYMLYITHWPVIAIAKAELAPLTTADRALLLLAIPVVAVLVYAVIDIPIERWRARIVRRFF